MKVRQESNSKHEIRNPKFETNSKSECSKFKTKAKSMEYTERTKLERIKTVGELERKSCDANACVENDFGGCVQKAREKE